MRRRRHVAVALSTAILTLVLLAPLPSAGAGAEEEVQLRGALPKNSAAHARLKAAAAARASAGARVGSRAAAQAPQPSAPAAFVSWAGINDEGVTPSDSTGAVGPDRYIENINLMYAIYDRAGVLIDSGPSTDFTGVPATRSVFDPQIMWDAQTQRFYYAWDSVEPGFTNSYIAFGWSTDASPDSPADFCHYEFDPYPGSDLFPDYPKLGDSQDWGLVGVNVFDPPGFGFVRSDAIFFKKPGPGTACPALADVAKGVKMDLRDQTGTQTFTPVPANSVDSATPLFDGVIISNDPYDFGEQTFITRFKVFSGPLGPVIQNPGTSIPIPAYSFPANADQPGLPASIDSLDGRHTQAVFARDPRLGTRTVWTQHTVFGGNGAEVRWYEVNPVSNTVLQSGVVTSPSLDIYNAAISPDRANNGVTQAFGANMVLGLNTSSLVEFIKIQMVSKVGAAAQSGLVLVVASPGETFDHSCCPNRWGDYSAATPDPAADQTAATGQVWATNGWTDDSPAFDIDTDWRTWNWGATP
jgi:hypothetical protein